MNHYVEEYRNFLGFGRTTNFGKIRRRNATQSKGWAKESRKLDRKSLSNRCMLSPKERKYPVCNRKGEYDCRGVLAALQRSRKGSVIHKKALKLGKKLKCGWA